MNHPNPTTSPKTGYLFAVTSSFGAGLATVVGKWNLAEVSALAMSCIIFTVATLALTIGWLPFKGLRQVLAVSRRGWFWIMMFTITSWLAIWFFWEGVRQMDPSLAGFINRLEVPIIILLGVIFLRERFTRLETAGVVISLIGIVLMKLTLRVEFTTGFWFVIMSAIMFGLAEFVSKIGIRHVEPIILAYHRNFLLAVGYWVALFASGDSLAGIGEVWPGVVALGLIGPILSRMMYLMALKHLDLSKVAVISQSQPVFVILIAFTFLNQLPTFREIVGGLFLLVGCVIMVLGRHGRRHHEVTET